mmetsp:Transcript_19056/g.32993  ORF Transcript_19056/g.32993 Transcript_19056/m.32993 type:complete len:472 (+) Transcript_19056:99-1514(+)
MAPSHALAGSVAVLWLSVVLPAASQDTCTCDCCQAQSRPLSQQVRHVDVMCASLSESSSSCPAGGLCRAEAGSTAVTSSEGEMQYSRFCMTSCTPENADEFKAGINDACKKVPIEDMRAAYPNGMDPANLANPPVSIAGEELKDKDAPPEPPELTKEGEDGGEAPTEAPQLADQTDLKVANAKAAALAAAAPANEEADKETGAMVAEASGKAAWAAGLEARSSEAEATSAVLLGTAQGALRDARAGVKLISGGKAEIAAAAVQAMIYARSASKAAARAKAELKELEGIPKEVADEAADEAVRQMQEQVHDAAARKAWMEARNSAPAAPPPLAEAAVRASAPYYDIMQRALSVAGLYESNARSLEDKAHTLQSQARTLASQAVSYQSAGYAGYAQKLMSQAKGMLAQATADDAQAQKDMAIAQKAHDAVPNYQANAAQAAGRAQALANPAGQPIIPRSPLLLQRRARRHTTE